MRSRKQAGWLLLGNLLAIAIAALVAVLGVRAYQFYQRSVRVQEINLDLHRMWQVGMDYYTATGCVWQETTPRVSAFAGEMQPSWEQLAQLDEGELPYAGGRGPWIESYQLRVTREQEDATEEEPEQLISHYHLQVEAAVKDLDTVQLRYLGKRLHATAIDEENGLLVWDRLASTLRGSQQRRYQPLQADNVGETQMGGQDDESASRYNCR